MNKITELKYLKIIEKLPELYPNYSIDYNTITKTIVFTNKNLKTGEQWTIQLDSLNGVNNLIQWIDKCIELNQNTDMTFHKGKL